MDAHDAWQYKISLPTPLWVLLHLPIKYKLRKDQVFGDQVFGDQVFGIF